MAESISTRRSLVYRHEPALFMIMLVISLAVWGLLIVGTLGLALVYVLLGFIFYLFIQSAFISYIKGTGVRVTPEQFPDLHARLTACSEKLGLKSVPEAYLLHANGIFNALATRFLGRNFIVLYSDITNSVISSAGIWCGDRGCGRRGCYRSSGQAIRGRVSTLAICTARRAAPRPRTHSGRWRRWRLAVRVGRRSTLTHIPVRMSADSGCRLMN